MGNQQSSTVATSTDYNSTRQQASEVAQLRDRAFAQSQECYRNGDHAQAKKFSDQGKSYANQMTALNKNAASQAFNEKNASRNMNEIDLHGLFVEEALKMFRNRVNQCRGAKIQTLHVITGKGIHSIDGHARIKAAVIEECEKSGLKCAIQTENTGVLDVEISPEGFIQKAIRLATKAFALLNRILK